MTDANEEMTDEGWAKQIISAVWRVAAPGDTRWLDREPLELPTLTSFIVRALAAAEARGAAGERDELRYIIEYARAQAVGTGNRDMVEACDFVLADAIRARQEG